MKNIFPLRNWVQYKPDSFNYIGNWIYNWFSNFTTCGFEIDGIMYGSVENYYQSHKSTNPEDWERLSKIAPRLVKKEGRKLPLRPDWEHVKFDVMIAGLRAKFSHDPWRSQLLETNDDILIEWNNWGDRIWGVSIRDCMGRNMLGMALMQIREEIRKEVENGD
jgi:ribA/ribD-fused uncharacterized protein